MTRGLLFSESHVRVNSGDNHTKRNAVAGWIFWQVARQLFFFFCLLWRRRQRQTRRCFSFLGCGGEGGQGEQKSIFHVPWFCVFVFPSCVGEEDRGQRVQNVFFYLLDSWRWMAMVVYMSRRVFSVCLLLICCFFFSAYRCGQASRLVAMGDGTPPASP